MVHRARTNHQRALIRQARLEGRPILGICAGSWDIWSAYGGSFKAVTSHCNRRGMPRILVKGRIGSNGQVHRIRVVGSTALAGMMGDTSGKDLQALPVNSVHWKAADDASIPLGMSVSAYSVRDNTLAPADMKGADADTIEGFESTFGALVAGVQWHPEAYNRTDRLCFCAERHLAILRYMAAAGQDFVNKKTMLRELKSMPFFEALRKRADMTASISLGCA